MPRSPVTILLAALIGAAAHAASPSIDVETRKLERLLADPSRSTLLLRHYQRALRQAPPEESSAEPDEQRGDPQSLAQALPALEQRLRELVPRVDTLSRNRVLAAAEAFGRARAQLQEGGPRAGYLVGVLQAMAAGQQQLEGALTASPPVTPLLLPAVQAAREAARRSTSTMIELALRAGVARERIAAAQAAMARGDLLHAAAAYTLAIGQYADGLGLASGGLAFSIDLFEQNLRSAFDPNSIGYAYAINQGGALARSGFNGQARTADNPPATLQSPTRKMHVASVSKTLTAIVTLNLLAAKGLTPDEPIGPWLPGSWARGAGVDALTFKQLMRHESGFDQNGVAGSSYAPLQEVIAKDVGSTAYNYNNANFGILRVLVAGLMGINAANFGAFDAGALTTAAFITQAQQLYGAIGMPYSCEPDAVNQTAIYRFPADGTVGYEHPSMSLACGGFGTFVSAEELARVLAFLRHSEQLLTPQARQWMNEHYLGLMRPSRYGFAEGVFGEYPSHGGDWTMSKGGKAGRLDACVMMFPIGVEVAVVVNSSGSESPYTPVAYQCSVLKWAFENAWVAP